MKGIRKMDEMELQITLRASRAAWFLLRVCLSAFYALCVALLFLLLLSLLSI